MKILKIATASTLLALGMGSANATIIDLFTEPAGGQFVNDVQAGVNPKHSWASGLGTTIGGSRDLIVDAIANTVDNGVANVCDGGDQCSRLSVAGGQLSFSNDTGINPGVIGHAEVQWDGDDRSANFDIDNGLNGADLVDQVGCPVAGCDTFVFEVLTADDGFNFSVEVFTDANNWTVVQLLSDGLPGISTLPFDFFQDVNNCGAGVLPVGVLSVTCGNGDTQPAMFTSVNAMRVRINTISNVAQIDLGIGSITKTAPEPQVLALMGLGLLGVVAGVRRRSGKTAA